MKSIGYYPKVRKKGDSPRQFFTEKGGPSPKISAFGSSRNFLIIILIISGKVMGNFEMRRFLTKFLTKIIFDKNDFFAKNQMEKWCHYPAVSFWSFRVKMSQPPLGHFAVLCQKLYFVFLQGR